MCWCLQPSLPQKSDYNWTKVWTVARPAWSSGSDNKVWMLAKVSSKASLISWRWAPRMAVVAPSSFWGGRHQPNLWRITGLDGNTYLGPNCAIKGYLLLQGNVIVCRVSSKLTLETNSRTKHLTNKRGIWLVWSWHVMAHLVGYQTTNQRVSLAINWSLTMGCHNEVDNWDQLAKVY